MIFSSNKAKSVLGFFLSAGILISCSENNSPQVKGANNSTFYVDALTAKFTTVGEANAQGKQNKKLLSFEACLKDNAQTNSVSNLKFDIVAGEVSATKTSDYRGCLLWQELIEFEPDAEVKNLFMTRYVVASESHSGKEKVVFSVNPYRDQFDFNRQGASGSFVDPGPISYKAKNISTQASSNYDYDIYVKINEDLNSLLSPIRRQAEVTALRLDYRNIDYPNIEVDSKLNLTFPYTYKTSLSMDLIRQDLGNIASEKIKRGNFMFSLVFLKEMTKVDNPKTSDVVAAVQWTAKPRGDAGLIEVPISVKFANIPALSSRMSVLLTITSLDNPILFNDQSYDGVVNGITANENLEIALISNENSARELHEKYETEKANKPVSNLTAKEVLESEGFLALTRTNVSFLRNKGFWSKPTSENVDLAKVVENLGENQDVTKIEAEAICMAYFNDKVPATDSRLKDCMDSPNGVLRAEVREFVVNVNGKPTNISFGRTENLKISAAFELSQGLARTSGYNLQSNIGGNLDAGVSAKAGVCSNPFGCAGTQEPGIPAAGVGANMGVGMNIGLGGKAYGTRAFQKQAKDEKVVSISSTEAVSSQPIAIALDVTTSKCLLISPNENYKAMSKIVGQMPGSRYFCSKNALKSQTTEYFFLLNHKRVDGNSSVTDMHSAVVNPLRMLVRGQRPYELLKGILTSDKFKYKLFVGMNADQVTEDATNFMTQEAPLMLSSGRRVVLGKTK